MDNKLNIEMISNKLFEIGAKIYENGGRNLLHASGHACQEDLRLMLRLVNPTYFMPFHGDFRMLKKHGHLAKEMGVLEKNIFVCQNGEVIEAQGKDFFLSKSKVSAQPSYIFNKKLLPVKELESSITTRKKMAQGGLILVLIFYDKKKEQLIEFPYIFTYGFINMKKYGELIDEWKNKISEQVKNKAKNLNLEEELKIYVENEFLETEASLRDKLKKAEEKANSQHDYLLGVIFGAITFIGSRKRSKRIEKASQELEELKKRKAELEKKLGALEDLEKSKKQYPKNNRNNITEIKIGAFELRRKGKLKENEYLTDSLKIEGFNELKEFNCYNNQITNLEFVNCPKLKIIDCSDGRLKSLNIQKISSLEKLNCSNNLLITIDLSHNKQLKELNIRDNDFERQDLSFLSCLVNLERLNLENSDRGPYMRCYNKFHGSLKPLSNLNELKYLEISDTDIDRGLEYLPGSVTSFRCRVNARQNAKVKYLSREACAKEETQEEIKNRIKNSLPSWNLTEKLSEVIGEAKKINTLERYKKLVKEMPFNDVQLEELEKIESNYDHRKKIKDEIKEKFAESLSKISEMDAIKNLVFSLKEKRTGITKALSSGKGSSAHIHKEVKALQDKISDYENLVKELRLSRDMLVSGVNKEIIEDQEYLHNSLQELQREDNEPV
ncbi:2073_t:CDS:2 [Funneliformis geosporum]|nr:2073_t:CDS:2 [Funneliformis geosporum]